MDYLVKISDVVTMLEELATKAKDLWDEYDDAAAFGVMSAYAAAEKQVKSIPPAQQWIPCSERLPDKYDEYQVTWTTSASSRPFISNIEYTESGWICDIYMMNYPNIAITAWQPLPEPYRGE